MTTVLKHFAVATEFPISGRCEIEELEDAVDIPTTPSYIPTLIETLIEEVQINNASFITIEQNFNELNKNLIGNIRESFLIDSKGLPSLKNQYTSWEAFGNAPKGFALINNGISYGSKCYFYDDEDDQSQISIDGILLCGVAGRPQWQESLHVQMRLGKRPTQIEGNAYSLNVRGSLKPEITPAREPVEFNFWYSSPPKWKALRDIVNKAGGRLWMKLLEEFIPKGLTSENFWQLLVVHNGDARHIPLNSLWQQVSVPLLKNEKANWTKISDLTKLRLHQDEDDWHFTTLDNQRVKLPLFFVEWEKGGRHTVNIRGKYLSNIQSQINTVILALSHLAFENDRVVLNVCPPDDDLVTTASLAIIENRWTGIQTLRYTNNAKDFITVKIPVKTANSSHPLVQQCLKARDTDALSEFASSFEPCIVDVICSKKQERSFAKPDRWMKYSAHCYFAVDWSKYQDNLLQPPYKIWLEDKGIVEITENDLMSWRDSKTKTT